MTLYNLHARANVEVKRNQFHDGFLLFDKASQSRAYNLAIKSEQQLSAVCCRFDFRCIAEGVPRAYLLIEGGNFDDQLLRPHVGDANYLVLITRKPQTFFVVIQFTFGNNRK